MIPKALKQIHVKELGFFELLRGGFELWRANFNTLVLTFASVSIPATLINHLLSLKISGKTYFAFGSLIPLVAGVITALACPLIVESYLIKTKLTYSQALRAAAKKFIPGVVVGLLFHLGLVVGMILLVVPGVLFSLYFLFALPSVILRETSGFDAFRYSYAVAKNYLGALFVKTLGVAVLFALMFLLTLPLARLQSLFPNILSLILASILQSFPIVVTILIYLNFDYLKNGFPGETYAEELSEPSQVALAAGDVTANTISALEERARRSQIENDAGKKGRSSLLQSKFFKKIANQFLQDKDALALEELKTGETETPGDMRIKQKIAETYYKMNRSDEAANTFLEIARHFEGENFFMKAIKTYKSILQIKPDLIEINLKLAELYRKMNMTLEASNQYRIAITAFAGVGNKPKALSLAEELVKIDPSQENRTKLAEIYQVNGMKEEALGQYEDLAKQYRIEKKYDRLLHIYELILPHRPQNTAIVKDICVLHLRAQNPQRALQIIEQYKLTRDEGFKELVEKAGLMIEVLKRQKTG